MANPQDRVMILELENRTLRHENEELKEEKRHILAEKLRYERDYREQKKEYQSLTNNMLKQIPANIDTSLVDEVLKEGDKQREKLEMEKVTLQTIIDDLKRENNELRRRSTNQVIPDSSLLRDQLQRAREQITELNCSKELLEEHNKSIKRDKDRAEREVQFVTEDNKKLEHDYHQQQNRTRQLQNELDDTKRNFQQQQNRIRQLQNELDDTKRNFQQQIDDMIRQKKLIESQNEELRMKLHNSGPQSDLQQRQLRADLQHLERENQRLITVDSQNRTLQNEVELLKKEIAERAARNSSCEAQLRELRQQMESKQSTQDGHQAIEYYREEIERLKRDYKSLENYKKTLQDHNDTMTKRWEEAKKDNKELRHVVENHQKNVASERQEYQKRRNEWEKEKEKLLLEKTELMTKVTDLESQIMELKRRQQSYFKEPMSPSYGESGRKLSNSGTKVHFHTDINPQPDEVKSEESFDKPVTFEEFSKLQEKMDEITAMMEEAKKENKDLKERAKARNLM